ncbi:CHAD domain-containing protein [Kribbella sp. VKM Ac-2571]|uniref:CHAD domain-containing protein n=1 Tax=Kribbella sp. VKM Ac-2571 TaxID=2512222 RepID=UPI00105BDC81|nr:CHAD domain-containing protein [Kribbella sp. VKM Ac-2571]TDO55980.1 CHAD domain-containing protein [Kribbella sp. VKM Ac-2571]
MEGAAGDQPVGVLVGTVLAKGARRLEKSVGMVENGEDDAIHQVRVSCRRLRSDLKLFRNLLAGDWATELRADLAALAQACGEARDLEVIAALVRETATSEDNQEHVETILTTLTLGLERAAARSAEVVLGESTKDLLTTIEAVAAAPDLNAKAGKPCNEVLPQLLRSATERFTQAADKLKPWTPDDDWHEVRLLAKRVRYAADTSAAVFGDEARTTAAHAATYQDLLGQHQDNCAAADALTAMAVDAAAQDDPELSFTLGRLTERHRAARKPLREQFLSLYHRP